jgi:C4-dicarboxylate-specific signal transduction histidine kinase
MPPKLLIFSASNYTSGIKTQFKNEDINILEATDEKDLLTKIGALPVDLFIFDSNNEKELFSLSEKVRTSKLNTQTPILFLSVRKISLENALESLYSSPIMSVVKPFSPRDLTNTARLLINFKIQKEALEEKNRKLEEAIKENETNAKIIEDQRIQLFNKSKLSSLGEMASGMAHEINSPLAIITMRAGHMLDALRSGRRADFDFETNLNKIQLTTERIAKIIKGLHSFAREGREDTPADTKVFDIIDSTTCFCQERFFSYGVSLIIERSPEVENVRFMCRSVEISQVLLNLLNNSFDAVQSLSDKWVKVQVFDSDDWIKIVVTDSGAGIPIEIQTKIMQPFFTTKEVGKGTGLGLSISKGLIERHNGRLYLNNSSPNTQFVIAIPKIAE